MVPGARGADDRTDGESGGHLRPLDPTTERVAVYGLDVGGLELVAALARHASVVYGVSDRDDRVGRLERGDPPGELDDRTGDRIVAAIRDDVFEPTVDARRASTDASVHVVAAPVGVREDQLVDLRAVRTAIRDVASGLDRGELVLVESPLPPRTCRSVLHPMLTEESGLQADEFGMAYCAIRRGGSTTPGIGSRPTAIVGGLDARSTRAALEVYRDLSTGSVRTVSSATAAECAGLARDLHGYLTASLAGELAQLADEFDIDVTEALAAAERFDGCTFQPPTAVLNGDCLPYAPYRVLRETGTDTPLVRAARDANVELPTFLVRTVIRALLDADRLVEESTVALCGLLSIPDASVRQLSSAIPIASNFASSGADVLAVDPRVDDFSPYDATPARLSELPRRDVDAVVVLEDRPEFDEFDWSALDAVITVDGPGTLDQAAGHHYVLGRGVVD